MIKAIIFDLDGVIVDATEWHYIALNRALSLFGYTITRQEHQNLYNGLPTSVKLEMLSQRKQLPNILHDFIHELKQKYTRQSIETSCAPDISVSAMLRHLKVQGYKLALASNAIRATVDSILNKMAIKQYFDITFSNEDVKKTKPDPEIYFKCMNFLNVKPSECVIVEDSMPGIQAARLSGAHVLIVSGTEEVNIENLLSYIKKLKYEKKKISSDCFKVSDSKLQIVIPMAGLGQRFKAAGYKEPKPLIKIMNKPMIQWVVENIRLSKKPYQVSFICNKEHIDLYGMDELLKKLEPSAAIVELSSVTEGAACTILVASESIDMNRPLLIVNSDQFVEVNIDDFINDAEKKHVDGHIMTFFSNNAKWSYAKVNEFLEVTEVAEKIPISNHATVGIYYFRKAEDFILGAMDMIRNDRRVNGEFYVCPVYNELIKRRKRVSIFEIETSKMHGLGTPEDLELFRIWLEKLGKTNHLKEREYLEERLLSCSV